MIHVFSGPKLFLMMKKSPAVYFLFALALLGLLAFFCWKYVSGEKVGASSLPLVKIDIPNDAPPVVRNVCLCCVLEPLLNTYDVLSQLILTLTQRDCYCPHIKMRKHSES